MKTLTLALPALVLIGCATTPPAPTVHRVNGVPVYQNNAEAKSGKQFIYTESPATPCMSFTRPNRPKRFWMNSRSLTLSSARPRLMSALTCPKAPYRCRRYPSSPAASRPRLIRPPACPCLQEPLRRRRPALGGIPGRLFDTNELATQQTKREVERLFGRPLRMAGVTLVDAAQTNLPELSLEILISERDLKVVGLNGERSYTVPDIQVTATQAADGTIVGQASVLDLFPAQCRRAHRHALRHPSAHRSHGALANANMSATAQ